MIDKTGIEISFHLTNEGEFETNVNFNEANDKSSQLFALFLSSLEKEQSLIYNTVIKRLKDFIKKEKYIDEIEMVFKYKSTLDQNLDTQVMRPSDVFNSLSKK